MKYLLLFCLSCGPGQNFEDKPIRRAYDGGISFFPELEKINAHCKKWAEGKYITGTGVVKYEYCAEW